MRISVASGGHMLRYFILAIISLSLLRSVSWGADKPQFFAQKDFVNIIMEQLSWKSGLPKNPADRDYLMVLGGKRSFRYEAENAYNAETDLVTVRDFPLFGAFTGSGWVSGISDATESTFSILLPLGGEYELKAVIKGNGFVWSIDGKEYRADSKSVNFKETSIAKIKLNAGVVTIKLGIPPEGAIDSFSLSAANHPPVQPLMGWRFKEALTAVRLAEILISLTNSYAQLPDVGPLGSPKPVAVSEITDLPPSVALTDAVYLGHFSSAKWVRADYRGATLKVPLMIPETGYYRLTANVMGENITGSVNEIPFRLSAKPYLSKEVLGVYRLESGANNLSITLPIAGGIDTIEFSKKSLTPNDILRLAGVSGPPGRLIGAKEAAEQLKRIQGSLLIRN